MSSPGQAPDDVALVVGALMTGGLCAMCIARTTGVPLARVGVLVETAAETFVTTQATRRCDGCLRVAAIVRLGPER